MALATPTPRVGELLRDWRQRRNLSQMEVSLDSAVSSRHLSFIETGRARPSREMVLHLAERLEVPLRERNRLLLAAGFAPEYRERSLDDAEMAPVRDALDRFLRAHEPFPALVVDGHWNMVAANAGIGIVTAGVAPELLADGPPNALRLALHPDGLAPRIANFADWSGHLMHRLRRAAAITADPRLQELHDELADYPGVERDPPHGHGVGEELVLPLRLRHEGHELELFSTMTTFGSAVDITLTELSVEAFYPADEATTAILREVVAAGH
ncbi:helix-turn-helix domain-containing protein [Patulibacter defluvii]|uniref:helix-turn-helix domain-containing protein n=1 Tax=Patulibacter defluvii TaxID=3095358 RepID=UPI002A7500FF|nr:helix-turn-helix transcriptional regulator [Patulibacter sp. DM4]